MPWRSARRYIKEPLRFNVHWRKGCAKKKSRTQGCFILIRSHGPSPPPPILPKKEINHKTKHRPYAYIWPKCSVWPPLHLSSHNHPPEMRLRQVKVTLYDISICCNKIFVIRLWLDYDLQAPQWSKSLLPHILHTSKGGADINILTCHNIEACLAWQPGGCPDV